MFERIVAEAPGNRTLSQAESKELADKQIPEYTVTVISRPSTSPTIEVSPILDRTLPPWILTFENFLTPEECKTLIGLGYEHGYERSRDVGDQKFDGSFDGKESVGRTSENAWCSAMKGCRDHDVVKRVMKRMSDVMGIPPENSEDLQLLKYEKGQFYNAVSQVRSHCTNVKAHALTLSLSFPDDSTMTIFRYVIRWHDSRYSLRDHSLTSYFPEFQHQRDRQCGPRILTFFLYLSDVEAGGGTKFNQLGHVVLPKAGKALLWPSVIDSDPTQADPRTTHEAMPVGEGTKFAANGWIHLYDYLGPQARGCN
jgi:prolyl 4-hydroxylase